MKTKISPELQEQAMKVAKGTKKPGQTKEQTKLIAQGIEKGIAEYKKQQNKKSREQDKQRKVKLKQQRKNNEVAELANNDNEEVKNSTLLPWGLLIISWIGFIGIYAFS